MIDAFLTMALPPIAAVVCWSLLAVTRKSQTRLADGISMREAWVGSGRRAQTMLWTDNAGIRVMRAIWKRRGASGLGADGTCEAVGARRASGTVG